MKGATLSRAWKEDGGGTRERSVGEARRRRRRRRRSIDERVHTYITICVQPGARAGV